MKVNIKKLGAIYRPSNFLFGISWLFSSILLVSNNSLAQEYAGFESKLNLAGDHSSWRFAPRRFSQKSLYGRYALAGVNDGPGGTSGAIGIFYFDGRGNVDALVDVNMPDEKGGRNLVGLMFKDGKYWVDFRGRGTFKGIQESKDIPDNFVIQSSDKYGIAQEIFFVFGDVTPSGALRTGTLTRLGFGRHRISSASVKGRYAVSAVNEGLHETTAGLGVFEFDGKGNVSIDIDLNRPDGMGGREVVQRKGAGKYWTGSDGRGSMEGVSGSTVVKDIFVVTSIDKTGTATELFVIYGDVSATIGALTTFKLTRQHPSRHTGWK